MSADPITLSLLIGSTALRTIGSVQQGRAAQAQANFQAAVQAQQATLQRQQADRERQLAAVEEAQLRRKQARELASARVRLTAAGREASTGSALLLQDDIAAQNEFNALLNRSMGLNRAYNLENQANLSSLNAARLRYQGSAARQSSLFEAGTSLLGGAREIRQLVK